MLIYFLDSMPKASAQGHCDYHVIRQIKDYCHILSSVHKAYGSHDKSKMLEPSKDRVVKWATESILNYRFLAEMTMYLSEEFKIRYKTYHRLATMCDYLHAVEPTMENNGLTPFDVTACIEFIDEDLADDFGNQEVYAWRTFYIEKRSPIASWRYTKKPDWYPEDAFQYLIAKTDTEFKKYIMEDFNFSTK